MSRRERDPEALAPWRDTPELETTGHVPAWVTATADYDYSQLRAHVKDRHARMVRSGLPRANADLSRAHARDHHRSVPSVLGHFHTPDNAGELVGPNTTERRPSGWYTGQHVEEKS